MKQQKEDFTKMRELAARIRAHAVTMTWRGKSGHVGSSLSMADIVSVLYLSILRIDPANPRNPDRDRFILSKGHAAAGVYAALAELNFFPKIWLETYYGDGGKLSGHISHYVPGVEFSTGSLGHGLPIGTGMALHAKRKKKKHRVIVLVSDGDMNEGSSWEAIMFAATQHLDNLTVILDANRIQALGRTKDIIDLEPLAEKLRLFHWGVREINGHDIREIYQSLAKLPAEKNRPTFVIARTIKGKGVSFFEDTVACHYRHCDDIQLEQAYKELGVRP
ncbi:MAG: transketolase [Candidatus Ratteibacteria bacterium]|jgi:transketolase